MTYDLDGKWNPDTGIHCALYPRSGQQGVDLELNVVRSRGKNASHVHIKTFQSTALSTNFYL